MELNEDVVCCVKERDNDAQLTAIFLNESLLILEFGSIHHTWRSLCINYLNWLYYFFASLESIEVWVNTGLYGFLCYSRNKSTIGMNH